MAMPARKKPHKHRGHDAHSKEYLRKLIHLLGIGAIPFSIYVSYDLTLYVTAIFCVGYLFAEYFRFKGESIGFITPLVEACAREKELKSWVLTPFYILLSIFILLFFFPRNAAYVGIVAATLGDASAAIVGMNFGRHRHRIIKWKSIEGSAAFFIATLVGSLFFLGFVSAVVISAIAAIVEIFSAEYDNITVPLTAAILAKHLACV